MSERIRLAAIGELLIDFTPAASAGNPMFEQNPGGAPANVLAAFTKLGGHTAMLGMVGEDMFGRYLRGVLRDTGIEDRGLKTTADAETTLAFVSIAPDGNRDFAFYRRPGADTQLAWTDVDTTILDECAILACGSLSQTTEPSRSATQQAVAYARAQGKTIAYDPNWRPSLWADQDAGIAAMRAGLPYADILKVSDEEAALLTGEHDWARAAEMLAAYGPRAVFVTLGADGCYYRLAGVEGHVPGYAVRAVDTTGSGDAFFGAALWRIDALGGLDVVTAADAPRIARFANAAGALCATRRGAIPAMPTAEEIAALTGEQWMGK